MMSTDIFIENSKSYITSMNLFFLFVQKSYLDLKIFFSLSFSLCALLFLFLVIIIIIFMFFFLFSYFGCAVIHNIASSFPHVQIIRSYKKQFF